MLFSKVLELGLRKNFVRRYAFMGKFAMFIIMTVYFMTVVGWPGVLAAPVWYTLIKAWSWTMRELENQA